MAISWTHAVHLNCYLESLAVDLANLRIKGLVVVEARANQSSFSTRQIRIQTQESL